jgi:Tol biopolymer transport system component
MRRAHESPLALITLFLLAPVTSCDNAPTGPIEEVTPPVDTPAISATLEISATTTGAAFDADDYVVLVDGVEIGHRLGLIDNISVSGEPGQTMDGPPRRTVTLVDDSVTNASFAVHCVAPAGLEGARLVFATGSCDIPGMMAYHGVCDLYTLPLDGSEGRFLTTEGHSFQPAISADGSTIAFARQSSDWRTDVYAMDVDGKNPRPITDDGRSWDPSWSPDGTQIVRVYGLAYPGWPGELQIWRFDDEDASSLPLPTPAFAPAWSPDGNRIAFTGAGSGNIFTIAPDGHDAAVLAVGGTGPVWSPASDRLAYGMAGSVFVIGLNGEAGTQLLPGGQETAWMPTDWAPNGRWIALTRRESAGNDVYLYDVYLLRVDDGTMVRVTQDHRSSSAVFVPGT